MTPRRVDARCLVVRLAVAAAALVLAARVVHVQVVLHEECLAACRSQWWEETAVPAVRGDIHDRDGRPLALSVPSWRVGVAPSLLSDPGPVAADLAAVLGRDEADVRRRLVAASRHTVLAREVVLTRAQKALLRGHRAVTLDTMRSRIYPAGGVGAAMIGFCREGADTTVATGLEHGLRTLLAGRPGRCQSVATALPGRDLGHVVVQEARHGHDVRLTLDVELQAICEERLAASVAATGSRGGSVLVLDPRTGDVLAAASWPLVADRGRRQRDETVWQNRNFTVQFEPGSVFKIFAAASLLRRAAVDTATVYDCSDSHIGRGIRIRNDGGHEYGDLALMPAFAKSSNIWFARAVANLEPREMYRDLRDFGFGQATLAGYPGEAAGLLRAPAAWSGRSQPTLAIGQEVAVTALQLALAVGAVANGGTLYAPRLVSEVRDAEGNLVAAPAPRPLRRVLSGPLAALLREAMARVVREGTGVAAHVDWIEVAGKTGTAQKQREGSGYTPGAYVASFAGIVPRDEPRLVILTVLDEPHGIHHYAAQSAVPLFRDVLEEIRATTDWLTGAPGARTAPLAVASQAPAVRVPDVLHLTTAGALQRLASVGLACRGDERDGVVVAQLPSAGALCPADRAVRLVVAGRAAADEVAAPLCPDFSGLSNRQARGLAARLGIEVAIAGAGYAVRQEPPPGRPLRGEPVRLRMETRWR